MKKTLKDSTAEEKIIEAARKVFTDKGYAATRTRDIADEAGLNLALLNYYFKSKEKLFTIVMDEKLNQFFGILLPIINDMDTDLEEKVELITETYLKLLLSNSSLPLFVLSEIRNNPGQFGKRIKGEKFLHASVLIKQINEKRPDINPLHYVLNLLSLCIYPFLTKQVFEVNGIVDEKSYVKLIEERKSLIVKWFKAMIEIE